MSSNNKTTYVMEEAKPALLPKLRFPEFRGAWERKALEALGYFTGGGTPSKDNAAYWTGDIPWISSSDLNENSIFQINISRFITKQAVQESATKLVPAKSILLISRVGVGKLAVSTFPLCTSQDFTNFTPTETDPLFLAYLLKSQKETLLSFNQGTSIKGFTKDNIASLRLGFPQPAEQQKIADCLSSVDELIAAQARKVDALKAHKKGLMQQLFPREGETQPCHRFPEFQNDGEWRITTIGDLKPFVTSGSRGWAPFYAEQGELFVRITNLSRDSIYLDLEDSKFVQLPPGSNEGVRTQLKEHDVLISITADIGIIGYVDESVPSPAYINQHIALVRFDAEQLCGKYVAYFLASGKSQSLFRASTDTGTKAGMSLIGIQKIELMLPCLPEQQRIASCLSSLDDLITAESQQLEALKTHKKGLMQQLFPSTDEVAA